MDRQAGLEGGPDPTGDLGEGAPREIPSSGVIAGDLIEHVGDDVVLGWLAQY